MFYPSQMHLVFSHGILTLKKQQQKNTLKLIYSNVQFQHQTEQDFNYEVKHFIPEEYNLPLEGFSNAWKLKK